MKSVGCCDAFRVMMMMMCNQTVNVFVVSKKWVLDEQTFFLVVGKQREREKVPELIRKCAVEISSKDGTS